MHFSNYVEESCDKILSSVKKSPLNFFVQENQFSIYITVRKTEAKVKVSNNSKLEPQTEKEGPKYDALQKAYEQLKEEHEEVINYSESQNLKIGDLERTVWNMHEKVT